MSPIRTMVADQRERPGDAADQDDVVTSRSSVVSAVTRDIRSPGSLLVDRGDPQPQQPGDQAAPGGEHHRLGRALQHVPTERADGRVDQHQRGQQQQRAGH